MKQSWREREPKIMPHQYILTILVSNHFRGKSFWLEIKGPISISKAPGSGAKIACSSRCLGYGRQRHMAEHRNQPKLEPKASGWIGKRTHTHSGTSGKCSRSSSTQKLPSFSSKTMNKKRNKKNKRSEPNDKIKS